jgi:hypothetical protein
MESKNYLIKICLSTKFINKYPSTPLEGWVLDLEPIAAAAACVQAAQTL